MIDKLRRFVSDSLNSLIFFVACASINFSAAVSDLGLFLNTHNVGFGLALVIHGTIGVWCCFLANDARHDIKLKS